MNLKSPILLLAILIIIMILIIDVVYSDVISPYQTEDLLNPHMYVDEICSYNGELNIKGSNQTYVNCTCKEGFTNQYNPQYINNVQVQCGYVKKRRFITGFLSIFVPIGVDYFYLENYYIALLILFLCCTACIGNCLRFAFPSEIAKKDYFSDRINLFFVLLIGCLFLFWIINIALVLSGKIKDGNGIELLDDIPSLFK